MAMPEAGATAPAIALADQSGETVALDDGRIARVFAKVQPKQHDDLVLGALDELAA